MKTNQFKVSDNSDQLDYSAMRETWKEACTDMALGLAGVAFMVLAMFIVCWKFL